MSKVSEKTPENIKRSIVRLAEMKPQELQDDVPMNEVAEDSLQAYEILLGLEDEFNVCIMDRDYWRARTVGDVVKLVMSSDVAKPKIFSFIARSVMEPLNEVFGVPTAREKLVPNHENIKLVIKELAEFEDELEDGYLMSDVVENSMQSYEIILGLESAFRVCIADKDFFAAKTVGDVVNVVMNAR